ncbi:MAG: DUF3108 domain-containing protein [Gemmatimonadales bacterium]
MKLLAAALVAGAMMNPAPKPAPAPRAQAAVPHPAPQSYPFQVGEKFQYAAKLGILRLGTAWMSVTGVDTVRGHESFIFEFGLDASAPFYKSKNILQSWTGTQDLVSRRFHQDLVENGKPRKRYFEIFPDSLFYTQENRVGTKPTVSDPLDDAAFFYFLRTLPLEVGKTYTYERYFKKDLNPVKITVVKHEKMEMPDGSKADCVILNPVVGEDGLFAPRSKAMLWITNDERRIPVQIKAKLPFGSVTLQLESVTPAAGK